MAECKKCGTPIEEDELFCSNCGADQRAEDGRQKTEGREQGLEGRGRDSEPQQLSTDNPQLYRNGVSVLWNTARKFVEDTTGSFNLRLTPEVDLKNLEIRITSDFPAVGQLNKKIMACPGGIEKRVDIPFSAPEGSAGEIPFDIFLRFEQAGTEKIVCASQSHHIYKAEQAPQVVNYRYENNVKTGDGHANDQHVNVIGGDMPDLSKKEKKALWEEINAQENWEPLDLQPTDQFPEETVDDGCHSLRSLTHSNEASLLLVESSFVSDEKTAPHGQTRQDASSTQKKWLIAGAAAVLALVLFLMNHGKDDPLPVQVNVIQQSGEGAHSAQVNGSEAVAVNTPDSKPRPPVGSAESGLHVELGLVGGRIEFSAGEKLQYRIFSDRDCYVALLCHQSDGSTVVLFPNAWHRDAFVPGGREIFVPDANSGFEIVVSPPFGQDTVELIACTGTSEFHRMLSGLASRTSRGIPFVTEKSGMLTRGMSAVPKAGASSEWHRESLRVTTGQ